MLTDKDELLSCNIFEISFVLKELVSFIVRQKLINDCMWIHVSPFLS